MRFSTKAEYGLRAIVALGNSYPSVLSVSDISRREHISKKYLERLIGDLRKRGIVQSFKGKKGGYSLSTTPDKIIIGEVIEALEGPIAFMQCEKPACASKNCQPKKIWLQLGRQIRKTLYSTTLSDLIH